MSYHRFHRHIVLTGIATAAVLWGSAKVSKVSAATFNYVGPNNGSWQTAAFWSPFNPPFFVPPPGAGDVAIININRDVFLSNNVLGLAGLTLAAGGDLLTNGHQLQVTNGAHNAVTNIVGTGTMGNNTELFVQPVGTGLLVDIMNLTNGGELDLVNNAAVGVYNQLNIDALSIITGSGTIGFLSGPVGRRFDLQGTIRPDTDGTISLVAGSGTIDLDGLVHNDNLVDLTNSGSRLEVNGPLSDSFTGTIHMGSGSSLNMSLPWIFGPQPGNAGGASTIQFNPGVGNVATISGATMTIGGAGEHDANVNALSGIGRVTANAIIQSNADIYVSSGATLDFDGTVTYTGAASIMGLGTFDPGLNNSVVSNVTIATSIVDFDAGNWDISRQLTLNTSTIDTLMGNKFNNHAINIQSQVIGSSGRLTVNLPAGDSWTLDVNSTMNISAPSGGLVATNVAGSEFRIGGPINIDGNSQFTAPIDLLSLGIVLLNDSDSSWTLAADSQLSGGSVVGDGAFRSSSAVVTGHGLIGADVNFSGTSELWADNGTLRITGNLDNLGAVFGTAAPDGVLQVEDTNWDIALADEVVLQGGELTDGAVLTFVQNSGGLLRGQGLVSVNSLNNHGTIAADFNRTLELSERLDWDGSGSGSNNEGDGILAARQGNLLISHPMYQGPSFVGIIAIASGRSFTYETGGSNDEILFDDSTGDLEGSDVGRLLMTGGTLRADVVTHEGQFTIQAEPSTIVANEILFDDLGHTMIDSQLRLDTSNGLAALVEPNASFSGSGSLANTPGSVLITQNNAEIDVALVNEGQLFVGAGPFLSAIPAEFEARSFEQVASGELVIDLAGIGLNQFDRLSAAEGATLGGLLSVDLLSGFSPLGGDTFEIITAGGSGVSGTFASLSAPSLSGDLFWNTLYSANNVILEVLTPYTADFDMDGDVDGDDLAIWQASYNVNDMADADGDGDSDSGDFLKWQQQVGSGAPLAPALANVPEPTTLWLLLLGAASLSFGGRRSL